MSNIFASILSRLLQAGARRGEANATVLLPKIKQLGTFALVVSGVYSTGSLLQHFLLTWSFSIGPSMYPTQPATENFVLVDRTKRKGHGLKIGDIIQFHNPVFADQFAAKRIIGMPGDYVVRDPIYAPSVGGAAVPGVTDWRSDDEIKRGIELRDRDVPEMIQVPEGHVWVVGDNMSWSRDSRFFGPVPMALIQGKTFACAEGLFSWKSLGKEMTRIPKNQEEEYLYGGQGPIVDAGTGPGILKSIGSNKEDVD